MKSDKGITITALAIYIIIFLATIALLSLLTNYIYSNLQNIGSNSISSEEFNKFNVYFVVDTKQNNDANINPGSDNTEIVFENGTIYTYIKSEKAIYRNQVKIANKILKFEADTQNLESAGITKKTINITISTGDSFKNPNFSKTIKYVLKYW